MYGNAYLLKVVYFFIFSTIEVIPSSGPYSPSQPPESCNASGPHGGEEHCVTPIQPTAACYHTSSLLASSSS